MHCGFLSNSFLYFTHTSTVALYTYIVILSYLVLVIYILVFQFADFVEGDKT